MEAAVKQEKRATKQDQCGGKVAGAEPIIIRWSLISKSVAVADVLAQPSARDGNGHAERQ